MKIYRDDIGMSGLTETDPIFQAWLVAHKATPEQINEGVNDASYITPAMLAQSEYQRIPRSDDPPADTTKLWFDTSED